MWVTARLLGHSDVKTTMIYTHVLSRVPTGVHSPVDAVCGHRGGFHVDPYKLDFCHFYEAQTTLFHRDFGCWGRTFATPALLQGFQNARPMCFPLQFRKSAPTKTAKVEIRRREKPLDRAQPAEGKGKGTSATLAAVPTACYLGRKTKPRILCGSI